MVIALSGVQFGVKSNAKFDFTPKLHDTKCNFHFIIFILKSETLFVNLEEPDAFLFKNVHTFASSFTSRSLATVAK